MTIYYKPLLTGMALLAMAIGAHSAHAHGPAEGELQVEQVRGNIYQLTGNGGNIGVLTSDKGLLVIDDQYPQEADKIVHALAGLSDQPLRFLLNTHWHGDHTGGNAHFGANPDTMIVAHEQVRQRLQSGGEIPAFNLKVPPADAAALPVVTYDQSMRLHWGGQTIELIHADPAHTDGDTVIYFKEANVVHTGDLFFNGFYPFIDTASGGRIRGMIDGVDSILAQVDDNTLIIPGHGPLAKKAELQAFRDMLAMAADKVEALKKAGKTRQQVIDAKPTSQLDPTWGKGFLNPDVWTGIVFDSL